MPARPFIAIADDFSGAAEIAGTFTGMDYQWVTSNVDAAIPNDETSTVIDLDTRRLNPQQAESNIRGSQEDHPRKTLILQED